MLDPIFFSPPFEQCHGSTIVELPDGSLMVAWFAGTREGNNDTSIWLCKQESDRWTRPHVIAKCGNISHWNPVLFVSPEGKIMLYFKTGAFPDSWDTWLMEIDENGNEASPAVMLKSKELKEGKMTLGPVRGKMVITDSGAWIAPSSIEKILVRRFMGDSTVLWNCVIHRISDNGKTVHSSMIPFERDPGEFGGIIQPSVWEIASGNLAALCRSTNGYLYRTESIDDGYTWSTAMKTDLPNPNSAVDIVRTGETLALIYNPISGNWASRSNLSVAFSDPEGLTFSDPVTIESGLGSYSYPAMIPTKDGLLATYTNSRKTIGFAKIRIKDGKVIVESGPDSYEFVRDIESHYGPEYPYDEG
jgi:predicted neuraminidase